MTRLEAIRQFVQKSPDDPFPRYGLAMELRSVGQLDEAAQVFLDLEARFPAYVPQYLMHANLLGTLGRIPQAKEVLTRGLRAAEAARDDHALGELREALNSLSMNS